MLKSKEVQDLAKVAVCGFRLGLMCYELWDKPRNSDLQKRIPFIEGWMNQDLESLLKLWEKRYNSETQVQPLIAQKSLFNELSDAFTANDVYAQCMKLGIKTPVRMVIYQWSKMGFVKKIGKNKYSKIKKENVKK